MIVLPPGFFSHSGCGYGGPMPCWAWVILAPLLLVLFCECLWIGWAIVIFPDLPHLCVLKFCL